MRSCYPRRASEISGGSRREGTWSAHVEGFGGRSNVRSIDVEKVRERLMSGERSYVVDELRRVNCLHFCVYTCHLGQCQIILGVLRDSTLGLGVAGSESSVEDVILFILAVSFSDLVEYQDGITDGVRICLRLGGGMISSLRRIIQGSLWSVSQVLFAILAFGRPAMLFWYWCWKKEIPREGEEDLAHLPY
jgi:hypothetical protein